MKKHNPQAHGNRVCHVCTRIMEDNFENDQLIETSSASSTTSPRSSISSTSSSRYALSEPRSYQADHSSTPSSASDFEFPGENVHAEPIEPEYPIKLADIEYMAEKMEYRHSFDKKKSFVMTQKSLQPFGKFKPEEKASKVQKKSIPKITKACKHDLTKKHKSCEVCYECKSCKDMFLKKSKKLSGSRSYEDEAYDFKTCGALKVKEGNIKNSI